MSLIDDWVDSTQGFAARLAEQAQRLQAVPSGDRAALRESGRGLLGTLIGGLPLMPECEALRVVQSLGASAGKIDPAAAERLGPALDASNRLLSLTGGGGLGPTVWAQERTGLPGLLERVPLPAKERRVVDTMLWTGDMFESSAKALDGVSREIERQDGTGERQAREAAREIEDKAQHPPVQPGLIPRVLTAIAGFFGSLFG